MKVSLSELINRVKVPIKILDKEEYSLVTIRMNNKGIKLREKKSGALIRTKSLYEVREGQFALSGIDARNGAYGIVPPELNGAVVSNDFWTHEINEGKVDRDFFSILISTEDFLLRCQKASEGTTNRQRLQASVFYNLEFDIPSLPEQKIFAKKILDGKGTTSKFFDELTTQQTLITQLRQSILQEAVQGKLVKQNKNDEPASELLKRIQAEKEKRIKQGKLKKEKQLPPISENEIHYQIPKSWEWCRLGDISIIARGSSPRPKGDSRYFSKIKTEYNWITISDISNYSKNYILYETREYLTKLGTTMSRYADKDEFIIAVSGSTTGKCCITGISGYFYDGLASVKFIDKAISNEYLLLYMLQYYEHINTSVEGLFPNINTEFLKMLLLSIPSLPEQKRIVEKVNQLMQHCNELEQQVQQSISHAQQLMQAVLREVFEGKREHKIEKNMSLADEK